MADNYDFYTEGCFEVGCLQAGCHQAGCHWNALPYSNFQDTMAPSVPVTEWDIKMEDSPDHYQPSQNEVVSLPMPNIFKSEQGSKRANTWSNPPTYEADGYQKDELKKALTWNGFASATNGVHVLQNPYIQEPTSGLLSGPGFLYEAHGEDSTSPLLSQISPSASPRFVDATEPRTSTFGAHQQSIVAFRNSSDSHPAKSSRATKGGAYQGHNDRHNTTTGEKQLADLSKDENWKQHIVPLEEPSAPEQGKVGCIFLECDRFYASKDTWMEHIIAKHDKYKKYYCVHAGRSESYYHKSMALRFHTRHNPPETQTDSLGRTKTYKVPCNLKDKILAQDGVRSKVGRMFWPCPCCNTKLFTNGEGLFEHLQQHHAPNATRSYECMIGNLLKQPGISDQLRGRKVRITYLMQKWRKRGDFNMLRRSLEVGNWRGDSLDDAGAASNALQYMSQSAKSAFDPPIA